MECVNIDSKMDEILKEAQKKLQKVMIPASWTAKSFCSKVIASINLAESPEMLVWVLGVLGVPVSDAAKTSNTQKSSLGDSPRFIEAITLLQKALAVPGAGSRGHRQTLQ